MRLNESDKLIMFDNTQLLKFCREAGISMDKLRHCNIERMGKTYVFVLSKENKPISKQLLPLDIDIATQPDVVLTLEIKDGKYQFETFEKTVRVLNV